MPQPQHGRPSIGDWIHVREQSERPSREIWYSPTKDITAIRSKDWIEYRDHSSGIYYSYDASEQILYRVPEYQPHRATHYFQTAEGLSLLLQSDKLPENPLELLFPDERGTESEVVTQSLNKIDRADNQWLEYRLTLRSAGTPDAAHWVFHAEPDSKVLRFARATATTDGKEFIYELQFDYPDTGPADIYALGVPRTAQLIDRELPKKIQQIVNTLRIGRQRMDDYRAIVAERMVGSRHMWWLGERNMIMYRKGDKFRVDTAHWFGGLTDYAMVEKPPDDTDMEAWWRERVDAFMYFPYHLSSDSMVQHINAEVATESDGQECWRVKSIDARKECGKPGDIFPPYYSRTPEFACRPPLGIPNQNRKPTVMPSSADGPEETILLEVRESGRMPTCCGPNCDTGRPQPNLHRFWLDPARDFVVARFDMVYQRDSGDEELVHSTRIDELDQSPNGTWYATRMRIKAVPPVKHDEIFHFYMDFDVDLPDSLFDPPKVGDRLS
jgi:hypothetical protein